MKANYKLTNAQAPNHTKLGKADSRSLVVPDQLKKAGATENQIRALFSPNARFMTKLDSELISKSFKKGSHLLDIGCAWGKDSALLALDGYNVTGIDISNKEIQKAQEFTKNLAIPTKVNFKVGDATNLPLEDQSVDGCIIKACLTRIIDPESRLKVLQEAHRVLKNKGKTYLSVFGQRNDWRNFVRYLYFFLKTKEWGTFEIYKNKQNLWGELEHQVHHYSEKELRNLIQKANLKINDFQIKESRSFRNPKHVDNNFLVIAEKA